MIAFTDANGRRVTLLARDAAKTHFSGNSNSDTKAEEITLDFLNQLPPNVFIQHPVIVPDFVVAHTEI